MSRAHPLRGSRRCAPVAAAPPSSSAAQTLFAFRLVLERADVATKTARARLPVEIRWLDGARIGGVDALAAGREMKIGERDEAGIAREVVGAREELCVRERVANGAAVRVDGG